MPLFPVLRWKIRKGWDTGLDTHLEAETQSQGRKAGVPQASYRPYQEGTIVHWAMGSVMQELRVSVDRKAQWQEMVSRNYLEMETHELAGNQVEEHGVI